MSTAPGAAPSGYGPAMNADFARRLRFWVRAYPLRWRALRGAELIGLVADLADPDAHRLGARTAFDLLRGGWATRLREHPPLHTWLLYRFFNRRIPASYRAWAADDIDGFGFPVRNALSGLGPMLPVFVILSFGTPPPAWFWWAIPVVAALSLIFRPDRQREKARLKQLAPLPGERAAEGTFVIVDVAGVRLRAQSVLPWATTLLAVLGAFAVTAAALAPKVLVVTPDPNAARQGGVPGTMAILVAPLGGGRVVALAILAVALAVGLLLSVPARRRLQRLLEHRPAQPHRVLRPLAGTAQLNLAFWTGVAAALTAAEVSGLIVLGPSLALGTAAFVLLPGVISTQLLIRQTDDLTVAASDLWPIAARGRLPAVDQAVPALRPLPRIEVTRAPASDGRPA
jgi:hypothetical protein